MTQYKLYLNAAKRRHLEFNLTLDQFQLLVSKPCHYCELPPDFVKMGVDRVDPKLGYTIENCVSCCKLCNTRKGRGSYERFKGISTWNLLRNLYKKHGQDVSIEEE